MAGNADEWSTEIYTSSGEHRISGGNYLASPNAKPIIDTNIGIISKGTKGSDKTSSRPILYK